MKKLRTYILVVLSIGATLCHAMTNHLTTNTGLGNNYVMGIAQDRDGYMWIATEFGLYRFDGTDFRAFKAGPGSLGGNELNRLLSDTISNRLWIATQRRGLDMLDLNDFSFTNFTHQRDSTSIASDAVTSTAMAADGGLWISTYTDGLDHFNPTTGVFTHYNTRTRANWPSDRIWQVATDKSDNVYMGHTESGFTIFNPTTSEIANYRYDRTNTSSLPSDAVNTVFVDSHQRIWLGTDNGLARFSPFSKTFTRYIHTSDPTSIAANKVLDISEDESGRLLVATENGGLSILEDFDGSNAIFTNYTADSPDQTRICNKTVKSVFADFFGNIWVGTYGDGIDIIGEPTQPFHSISPSTSPFNTSNSSIMSLASNGDLLLAGTDGLGVDIFEPEGRAGTFNNLADNAVLAILSASDGSFWFGTYGGSIFRCAPGSRTPIKVHTTLRFDIRSIAELSSGDIVIGSSEGLSTIKPDGSDFKQLIPKDSSVVCELVRNVAIDKYGRIWTGTFGDGLMVFDSEMNRLAHLNIWNGLKSNNISQVLPLNDEGAWLATGEGLVKITPELTIDTIYGTEAGLDDTFIRALAKDATGNIWMSTMSGIAVLDTTGNIRKFRPGESKRPIDYNPAAVTTTESVICFGSHRGITWFRPTDFATMPGIPEPVITAVSIYKPGAPGHQTLLSPKNTITVPYNQNTIGVNFGILDPKWAHNVVFEYMVQGIDKQWLPCNNGNNIILSNLPYGKEYTLAVRAISRGSDSVSSVVTLPIRINAPIWATLWARILYALIIAAIVIFLIRLYTKRIAAEYALNLERNNARRQDELTAERMRFFTNITHELRTPLTLIIGPLEDIKSDPRVPAEIGHRIGLIHRSALRLLELINTILEFRKTETQNRELKVQCADIAGVVREIGNRYAELNTNKSLTISTDITPGDYSMWFDPEIIGIIIDNLMSNACKYTVQGKVQLSLYHTEESGVRFTEIAVSDSGIGMDDDTIGHIFDRYYRNKSANNCLGTGIGLALVYNLIKIHKGEIFVDSEPHRGSTFRFRLLTGETYPEAERREVVNTDSLPEVVIPTNDVDEHGSKPVLLIVEDNIDIINYITEVLADRYSIVSASNGAAGLEKARSIIPDIIVCDIMMPEMDGTTMINELKKDDNTSFIPVIVVTAKTAAEARIEAYEAGADSFISKPFSSRLLNSRIKNILDSRHHLATAGLLKHTDSTITLPESEVGAESSIISAMSQADAEFIEKVRTIIMTNISDDLDVKFIAEAMAMSHSTLYRKIKAITGQTVNNLIRRCRAREAERLITTGKYTLTEIATMVGLSSSSNFRQCFREEFGVNPSDYKKGR